MSVVETIIEPDGRKRRWNQFRIAAILVLMLGLPTFYVLSFGQSTQPNDLRRAEMIARFDRETIDKRNQKSWRRQAVKRQPVIRELEESNVYIHYKDGEVHLVNYCNAIGTSDGDLKKLLEFPKLHTLSLEQSGARSLELTIVAKLDSLNELWFDNCANLQDDDLSLLTGLPRLTVLNLRGTGVTDAGLVHIAKMTQLTSLCLHATQVSDEGMASLSRLQNLEFLWLSQTDVSDDGLQTLAHCPKLKGLAVNGSRITGRGIAKLREQIPGLATSPFSF